MSDDLYRRLAQALDHLPYGFPGTDSGVELEILRVMFAPDEAEIAGRLSEEWETAAQVAARAGLDGRDAEAKLRLMAMKGLVKAEKREGERMFSLNQFIVGSWEATMFRLEGDVAHRMAHLTEEYVAATGGLAGIMTPAPSIHRVVPARGTVKSEWILPYDDVRAFLTDARSFVLRDCVCRKQHDLLESRRCSFPRRSCLSFSPADRPAGPDSISRDEALAFLDEARSIGLVHTVSNVAKGINYVCNCCGCCCGILRGVVEYGLKDSVAQANYYCSVDKDACAGCGVCVDRCQVGAIRLEEEYAVADKDKCVGCGLCVPTCATGAAQLRLRPDAELVRPPEDLGAWAALRRANRNLAKG
ncbi:MAG: 4Fe-4S binding protein [bacterium]|nr:4Fe-4S binding protein [bacterium]